MIIPVFRPDGLHKLVGDDVKNADFKTLADAAFAGIKSWDEAGLRVPGYGLPVSGGFRLVDSKTHRVNKDLFRKQFKRDPTPADEAELIQDYLLSVMIAERKGCQPGRFIVFASCTSTTNAHGQEFRAQVRAHGQQAEEMLAVDRPSQQRQALDVSGSGEARSGFRARGRRLYHRRNLPRDFLCRLQPEGS
jgi:hypothetical protein